jgi:hypothetical protein
MLTGRIYAVSFSAIAVTAQQDLFEINVASTKMGVLHALFLSQVSEVADAAEEMLQLLIKTGATTSGSGGSTATPAPRHLGDSAWAGTVEINNTTKANTGTIVTHHSDNWNIRMPYQLILPPELWIPIAPSGRLTVELATTPADSITMNGTALIREIG